ncbi:hypothetical protein, partial [Moorena sp. SIO4A5]
MNTNKKIIHQIFRDGVSQRGRLLRELEPDYVGVDERDVYDLLTFVQEYATKLNYYDESNRINGNWSSFLAGDVEQMVAYINNPESFADEPSTQSKLAQPHLVLLFTFLQLLRYPQQQFKALTQRYLDFYYKEVLALTTKEEVPDKIHVIFELAQGEEAHLINKGTLLSAGQDSEGVNINYATDEDIVVNQAQVASLKTLFIEKNSIGLEEIHNQDNKSDQSFENMLRWAVGSPNQGDQLPKINVQVDGQTVDVDVDINYLKGTIYQATQDNKQTDNNITSYITEQLFFLNTDDFNYCFDIHDRQINKAQADKEEPTELEWNEVYKIIEKAYRKKITMGRRNALKEKREQEEREQEEREQLAFKSMMELALGHPNPGDPLPKMPNGYTTLQEIFDHLDQERVIRYVKEELYLSVADFRKIMEIQATTENTNWKEVYRLVEKAQTKKRNFTYPPIGKTEIKNIHASSIIEAEEGQATKAQRFKTFGNITQTPQKSIGFAVTSPVLLLQEGTRNITLTFTGEERTLNRDKFQAILSSENGPFEIYLSSEAQWIQPESFEYEIGVFLVEEPLVSYSSTEISLGSTASDNDNLTSVSFREGSEHTFSASNVKQLLVWNDGKIFQITGLVNNKKANIQQIGIGNLSQDAVSTGQIKLYRTSAIYFNSLQFQLTLDSTLPAILPPQPDQSTFFLDSPYPVVKILFKEISPSEKSEGKIIYYDQLKSISLEKVNIQVEVENIQDVQLRNDNLVLNPKSTVEPFGQNPKAGSGFYFANREISTKKLDSITINIEWMGLPKDFSTHYEAYNSTKVITEAITNDSFKASLKLRNNRSLVDIETSKPIFAQDGDNKLSNAIYLNYKKIPDYSLDTSTLETETDDPFEQNRYFKLELASPDFAFAHDLHLIVLNKVNSATDKDVVKDKNGTNVKNKDGKDIKIKSLTVYRPYTPQVKAISLDYTASEEIDLKNAPNQPHSSQIFQLHPFGYADIQTLYQDNQYYLLPNYQEEGTLYIGIRNLQPPQNISILFQMIPGSGNGELTPPQIHWSYLSGNSWQEFKDTEMLSDSTNGLVDSGIIRLSIPEGATSQQQLLPSGLHWLRGTVTENAAAIPDTLDIKTQAVRATFVNQGNAADHLSKPLPANSIQGFVTRDPAINTVQQPYSSFGGKPKEDNRAFTMRVSE